MNESEIDHENGSLIQGDKICKSLYYGLIPGNYVYETFNLATQLFPENVLLNINDYISNDYYANEIIELMNSGCKVDIVGFQMHLFNPQQCLDIANGKPIQIPEDLWKNMKNLSKPGLPIHLSEITITSPGDDEHGRAIQTIITRNLYRLWFSTEQMMGITWWNIVDGCGAPGEPAISGIFIRNTEPKAAFFTLNKLINEEWKTRTTVKIDENGSAKFRGFKGQYLVSWKDKAGKEQKSEFYLKNDEDGF